MNMALYLNGQLIGSGGSFSEPVTRNWNRALLFEIPAPLMQPGENVFHFRVFGYRSYNSGLSQIDIGPAAALRPTYENRYFWQTTGVVVTTCLMAVAALLGAIVWYWRRKAMYGYFVGAAFVWGLRNMNFIVRDIPVSTSAWTFLVQSCNGWFFTLFSIFILRFINVRLPVLEKLLWAFAVIGSAGMLIVGLDRMQTILLLWILPSIPLWFVMLDLIVRHARKSGDQSAYYVAGAMGMVGILTFYDWLILRGKLPFDWIFLGHYSAPILFLFIARLIVDRYSRVRNTFVDQGKRLQTTLMLSPDGFVFIDQGGKVAYMNPRAAGMMGVAVDAMIGLARADFMQRLFGLCAQSRATRESGAEAVCSSCTAKTEGILCPSMPVDVAGEPRRVLQVSLAKLAEESSSCVICLRDVTRETEVDRMKSEFLSTAAHELRSPMASILGFSDLLIKREYDEKKRGEMLGIIYQQASGLTRMLNELLDLARIEARAGRDFKMTVIPLAVVIRRAVSSLMVPGDARQVQVHLPEEPVLVRVDCEKLQQALTNVLSNAYKFSPQGGPIELEVLPRKEADIVRIRVTDHGIGMKPGELKRAGERFYRADSSGNIPGTGLGLSLVSEIMHLHGGYMKIDSTFGEGTQVTLWLPQYRPA
jgi:signal transduction histidine kinase